MLLRATLPAPPPLNAAQQTNTLTTNAIVRCRPSVEGTFANVADLMRLYLNRMESLSGAFAGLCSRTVPVGVFRFKEAAPFGLYTIPLRHSSFPSLSLSLFLLFNTDAVIH